jgi:hypothetical protein
MSLEVLVMLAAQHLPTAQSWVSAVKESHVPVQFPEQFDPNTTNGYVHVTLRERNTGLYFYRVNYRDVTTLYPKLAAVKVDRPVVYSLRYDPRPMECASVFYSASVLVARFGGAAFNQQTAAMMSEQELVEAAKECLPPP